MPRIRIIRISFLLLVFFMMAFYAKTQELKSRSWSTPLEVVIYPINGDTDNPIVENYINKLDSAVFAPIDQFFQKQIETHKNRAGRAFVRTSSGFSFARFECARYYLVGHPVQVVGISKHPRFEIESAQNSRFRSLPRSDRRP